MKSNRFGQHRTRIAALCCACVLQFAAASLSNADDGTARDPQLTAPERLQLAQRRQCEQRMGPFVTQETAWQRWRQARGQGQAVSQGVVPCHGQGIRGYCYFVFYAC